MTSLLRIITLCLTATALPVVASTTLVENVKGYTLNGEGDILTFTSMFIEDGKVVALNPASKQADTVINGNGKTLIPGLIDAHGLSLIHI